MLNEYCVGVVGVKNASVPSCPITHDKIKYELLINVNVAQLTSGIHTKRALHFAPSNCSNGLNCSYVLYRCSTFAGVLFEANNEPLR